MVKMPEKFKPVVFFFSLAILAAIVAGFLFHLRAERGNSESEEMEVEVVEGVTDEGKSLSGMLHDEATEEEIEQDAARLDVNANESTDAESKDHSEETGTDGQASLLLLDQEKSGAGELRIGFVTDIHARSNSNEDEKRALKPFFEEGVNYFLDRMNVSFKPDFIVEGGDLIEGTGRSSDIGEKELSLIRALFEKTAIPKYWVIGNHDLRSVKKDQWKETLGIDYLYKSFEVGGYKIIILDSNFTGANEDVVPDVYYTRGKVSEEEVAWLENELSGTDKEVIVFVHHPPLWDVDIKKNGFLLSNSKTLRQIFAKYGVLAVFSGHIEDIYIDEADGVKYFVLPGFVRDKKYQKTFSEITVKDGKIIVDMSYLADEEKYRTVRITDD